MRNNIQRDLVSGLYDIYFHGLRYAPQRAGAPVRATQCSAALLSRTISNGLNAFQNSNS